MATRQTNKLQIPVDISRYVVVYGLQKAFAIFLYLKFHSSGKLHKDSPVFKSVMKALRISDDRTYRKHFNKLIELNWINLNESSGIYHFRGFDRLRIEYNIRSKQATTLFYKHLKILDVYLVGVMLCAEVNKQKYFWEVVVRRKLRPVANKRDLPILPGFMPTAPNQSITVFACHKLPKCLDAVKQGLLNLGKKPPMPGLSKPFTNSQKLPACQNLIIISGHIWRSNFRS